MNLPCNSNTDKILDLRKVAVYASMVYLKETKMFERFFAQVLILSYFEGKALNLYD